MDQPQRQSFEQAALPHLDAAFNLARWLTRDEHAAEDVVQEAMVRAVRYFGSFHGGDGRPWLLAIVRRASFDWLSKNRAAGTVSYDELEHDPSDMSANPELLALRKIDRAQIQQAIEALPPEYREVIVLRELEGLSYKEIATVADLPIGTVMSRLSRARSQLQLRLAHAAPEDA